MCGIAGFLNFKSSPDQSHDLLAECATRMADAMVHRGPDDRGTWVDPSVGIGLGFRRLAIVDLSPAGHQPMVSSSGRYVIVFNGEIYNHLELRHELITVAEQHSSSLSSSSIEFRGHSDTEVLLAGIEGWGLEATLRKAVGMFAIALWDRRERVLSLARDRMGEKPLYYGLAGPTLIFGSELKALRAHPSFDATINRDVLRLYTRFGYVPGQHSIYHGIQKLLPGRTFSIQAATKRPEHLPAPKVYWSVRESAISGQANPLKLDPAEAVNELERLLLNSISGQMIADVPVGAFLSGGIDSSTVVALMQSLSSRPIQTFSIGFHESEFNEAVYAQRVAQHLGTDHTELYVTAAQAQAVIPQLPEVYDEPFADSSQIPTYLVSQLAKAHVTVSLSGDGGDELFGGYTRYFAAERIWRYASLIPAPVRKHISRAITNQSATAIDRMFFFLSPILKKYGSPARTGTKLRRVADVLKCTDFQQLYRSMVSLWKNPQKVVLDSEDTYSVLNDCLSLSGLTEMGRQMRFLDQLTYLPDDILVKVDRAAMAVSLESRVPLLDHRVVDFAWRLPNSLLRNCGKSKWILRQVLYKYVPKALVDRPKMGFGVPIGSWLRGSLRDWAEDLLDERKLINDGFLNAQEIRRRWKEHIQGIHDWQHQLWTILMFQAWRRHAESQSFILHRAA